MRANALLTVMLQLATHRSARLTWALSNRAASYSQQTGSFRTGTKRGSLTWKPAAIGELLRGFFTLPQNEMHVETGCISRPGSMREVEEGSVKCPADVAAVLAKWAKHAGLCSSLSILCPPVPTHPDPSVPIIIRPHSSLTRPDPSLTDTARPYPPPF